VHLECRILGDEDDAAIGEAKVDAGAPAERPR
jgi:hypothetical protein